MAGDSDVATQIQSPGAAAHPGRAGPGRSPPGGLAALAGDAARAVLARHNHLPPPPPPGKVCASGVPRPAFAEREGETRE